MHLLSTGHGELASISSNLHVVFFKIYIHVISCLVEGLHHPSDISWHALCRNNQYVQPHKRSLTSLLAAAEKSKQEINDDVMPSDGQFIPAHLTNVNGLSWLDPHNAGLHARIYKAATFMCTSPLSL